MLDIHDLLRAAAEDRIYLQWEDEDGLILGFLSRNEVADDHVTFFWRLFGTRNVEAGFGQETVAIRRRMAGKYWHKPSFECLTCPRQVTRLYYVQGRWACKKCHDLLSLVQRLDPVKKALYFRELYTAPPLTGPETAAELRKREKRKLKFGKAVSDLQGEVCTALPDHFQHRAVGRWLAPGELPKTRIGKDEIGYGWVPGMTGQLAGLGPEVAPRSAGERRWAGRPLAPPPRAPAPASAAASGIGAVRQPAADRDRSARAAPDPMAKFDLGLFDLPEISIDLPDILGPWPSANGDSTPGTG